MTRLTTLACVAFCLLASSAAAQQPPPQYPRLEMSVGLTSMSPGPAAGTERALRAIGLREGTAMTWSDIQGFWKVEIGTSDHRTLGILKSRVINYASGTAEIPGPVYGHVSAKHAVVTRAVTWSYRPNGWISVGAGPALHVRRFALRGTGSAVGVQSKRSLGAVAGVNLKWRRQRGGFAHALWQYRYAGSLNARNVDIPVYGRSANQHVKWPSTRIPFSHRMVGIGFGVEF